MKKLIIYSCTFLFGAVLFINTAITQTHSSTSSKSLLNLFTISSAIAETGSGTGYHERVIGCGSKRMEDWQAGCCAGMTSPCTDNCTKTEYCN